VTVVAGAQKGSNRSDHIKVVVMKIETELVVLLWSLEKESIEILFPENLQLVIRNDFL
jgi:hypothetical protein